MYCRVGTLRTLCTRIRFTNHLLLTLLLAMKIPERFSRESTLVQVLVYADRYGAIRIYYFADLYSYDLFRTTRTTFHIEYCTKVLSTSMFEFFKHERHFYYYLYYYIRCFTTVAIQHTGCKISGKSYTSRVCCVFSRERDNPSHKHTAYVP